MTRTRQTLKSLLLIIVFAAVVYGARPKVGDPAPQFTLPALAGDQVSLKSYAGKSKVVLVFYRGYW